MAEGGSRGVSSSGQPPNPGNRRPDAGDPPIDAPRDPGIHEAPKDDLEARRVVAAVLGGDRDAFRVLVERESRALVRSCYRVLGDLHDAEDAAQEAFVRAWRELPALRDADRWLPWFRRVTVNSALELNRRRGNGHATIALGELEPMPLPDETGHVATRDQVQRLVGCLDQADRALLVLRFGLDLEMPDVAAALDIPLGTAKSRLHRALARLRAQLEATDGR